MNRFTRMLTMAGLGLVTGVTIGAGPALASDSTGQGASRAGVSVDPWFDNDDERVVGFFRSRGICERAGEYGEDEGWWEDSYCYRVRAGFHDRRYALVVQYDDWGQGWNGHWGGNWVGQWWPGHGGGNWYKPHHKPWFPHNKPFKPFKPWYHNKPDHVKPLSGMQGPGAFGG